MMPRFEDFMEAFSYNPETFNADEFRAAITAAHNEDSAALTAIAAAKDADIATRDQQITKLGADNWKLLMKQGPKIEDVNNTSDSSGDAGDDKPKSIDSFFKKVERN